MPDNGDLKSTFKAEYVLDIRRLLKALVKNALLIISAGLLVSVLLAAKCAWKEKPKYKASFSILVGNKVAEADVNSISTADINASNQAANAYATSIKTSQYLIESAIAQAGLQDVVSFSQVKGAVSTDQSALTRQITVVVTMSNAEQCIRVAKGLAEVIPSILPDMIRGTSVRIVSSPLQSVGRTTADVKGEAKKGLIYGLAAAAALVLLLDVLDRRVRSKREIAGIAGETEISVIPAAKKSVLLPADGDAAYEESWKYLRTSLKPLMRDGSSVFAVCSAEGRAGRTSVALNLAEAFGQVGKKALCLEADLRNPEIGKYLGIEGGAGLCGIISENVSSKDAVLPSGRGYDVLPAGGVPDDATRILESPEMKKLLSELSGIYDVLLIDLPRALGYADALIAAGYADGFIFVARNGQSDITKIREVYGKLKKTGTLPAAFVYNDAGRAKL